MAQRSRRRSPVSTAETMDLHVRHERVLTMLGSNYTDLTPATVRRLLLRMAHQKQRLLQRAGVYPSAEANPLMGDDD